MRWKLLTLSIMVALAVSSTNAISIEEQEIEIRGPGGVVRPNSTTPTTYQQRASSTTNENRKHTPKDVSKKADEKKGLEATPNEVCKKMDYPKDILVPKPQIPRVDLNGIFNQITILKGDNIIKLATRSRPDDGVALDDYQIIAALYRQNPKSFGSNGPIADKQIQIPTTARIALEDPNVGKIIESKFNDHTIKNYKLPELDLPWAEEDASIAALKKQKDEREKKVHEIDKSYLDCLDKLTMEEKARLAKLEKAKNDAKTEIQLDDEELMIPDENETISDNGKRVVTLKDNSKSESPTVTDLDSVDSEQSSSDDPSVKGAALSFGEDTVTNPNKNESKEQVNAVNNTALMDKISSLEYQNKQLMEDNALQRQLLLELKEKFDNFSVNQEKQVEKASEVVQKEISDTKDSSLVMLISTSVAILMLLGGLGFALLRMKRNKMRQALSEDDDVGLDDLNVNVFDNSIGSISDDNFNTNDNLNATAKKVDPKKSPELSSDNIGLMPDLESPDEGIPDLVVEHVAPTDNPPDLVPPRYTNSASTGDLDESGFKDDLKKIKTRESEPIAPSAVSEIDIPTPNVARTMDDSIDLSEDAPEPVVAKTDENVMDEWASALEESKEAPKAEAPQKDADVMDEWASALEESKEAPKAEAPQKDADVMDEWASALEESKEAPKAEAPQKDADVMDEWASALEESKEAPKAKAPQKDADVMDEWASALEDSKNKK